MHVITEPRELDKFLWQDFVLNHPDGSIFQTPQMYEVFKGTRNYEPIFLTVNDENNNIQALLLAVIQKEYKGFAGILSARSVIIGGPLYLSQSPDSLDVILHEYNKIVGRKAVYTQIRNSSNQGKNITYFTRNGYKYIDHFNIVQNLRISQDMLWQGFSKSRKKGILKALNSDFKFEFSNEYDVIKEFHNLLTITYRKIKLPFPEEEYFVRLAATFGNENFGIFIIRKNDNPIVALFVLIYRKTMFGYYMGSVNDPGLLKLKPVDLIFWKVFKWAIERGIEYFDWMGAGSPSKKYGVRDFKLEYGGEVVNYGRFERIHKPFVYQISRAGLKFWQALR